MTDIYLELAEKQLGKLPDDVRLFIIHPNYLTQRYLMAQLVKPEAAYVRFDGDNLDGEALRSQLQRSLDEQVGDGDLAKVRNLILDECDRVESEALSQFINELVEVMLEENDGHITIVTRQTPHAILNNTTLRDRCVFIPVQEDMLLCDYIRDGDKPSLLEVHSFGTGRVYLNGEEIVTWDGVLPRSLFFYLVDRGMTTRDDIFKIFWPDLTTKEATNVFHVTKRKISEVLGIDLTTYWSGFYRISPDIELSYDAMHFTKLVQDSAVAEDDESRKLLMRAIALYRGEFLSNLDLPWTQERRQSLLQTYGEALVSLGKMAYQQGNKQEALGLFLRSALTNPQREDLVQDIMSLYTELGMIEDALASYERLENELKASLDVRPAPDLQQYAESLRARSA